MVPQTIKLLTSISIVFSLGLFSSCYYDKADKLYPNRTCDSTSVSFSSYVQPLINNQCISCHSSAFAIRLDNHAEVLKVANDGRLLNALKYISGGSKNMPPTAKLDDCSINKIEAWIRRGAPNN